MDKKGYVYILTNKSKSTLYIGDTSDLCRRVAEHKLHLNKGFSDKYNTEFLLYYEVFDLVEDAIAREKQLKKWNREWKDKMISEFNPQLGRFVGRYWCGCCLFENDKGCI